MIAGTRNLRCHLMVASRNDCVCDEKGFIKLADTDMSSWKLAVAKCSGACHRCERCSFITVSLQWKDCSWYSACPTTLEHGYHAFRTYRVKQSKADTASKCQCGFHRDCKRTYTAADIEAGVALWDPLNASNVALLQKQANRMRIMCHSKRTNGTTVMPRGGWCLGKPKRIDAMKAGVMRELPDGHEPVDIGIVNVLLKRILRSTSGQLLSLNDFGAGVGQFGRELLSKEPALEYHGYDGAGNVAKRTYGFVRFFDLTLPLSLPKTDWVMTFRVGEHIPPEHEELFVRNLHAHNLCGVVLSWAPLDRHGLSHINNHSPEYVIELFKDLGYAIDTNLTRELRHGASRRWMSEHLFVFRRHRAQSSKCSPSVENGTVAS